MEPQSEAAAPAGTSNVWVWAVLFTMFALMIGLQVVDVGGTPKEETVSTSGLVVNLKSAMLAQSAESTRQVASPELPGMRTAQSQLKAVYDEAFKSRAKSDVAALATLAAGHELRLKPDPGAVAKLQRSKSASYRTLAKVYAAESIDPALAAEAKAAAPRNFLGRLVAAQAVERSGGPKSSSSVVSIVDTVQMGAIVLMSLGAIVLGLMALLLGVIVLILVRPKPAGFPVQGMSRADGDRFAWRMALFLAGFLIVPGVVAQLFMGRLVTGVATVIGMAAFFGLFVMVCSSTAFGVADPVRKLMGSLTGVPKLVGLGLAGFLANVPLVAIFALAAERASRDAPRPTHPLAEQLVMGGHPLTLVCFFLLAAVFAPLLEELSFRGLLLPALGQYVRPWAAIVLTGLLFAAVHPQGPVLWLALGTVGAMAATLTYYTGSLLPAMVMHAVHNASILTLGVVLAS